MKLVQTCLDGAFFIVKRHFKCSQETSVHMSVYKQTDDDPEQMMEEDPSCI